MVMMMSKINLAILSDVHLGHKKTPISHTVKLLRDAFPPTPSTAELDMVIIAGDLFDQMMYYSEDAVSIFQEWILEFLLLCRRYNIALRILEGTPLHDRGQSKHIKTLAISGEMGVDVKYVDKLAIVHEDRWNIDMLYVPDEWHHDPDHTWLDVIQELKQHNLEQVDFAVMHGMFKHQVPPACKDIPHDNERYGGVVKHYIYVGHIHQCSFRGKVVAPGSFDRGSHGDEKDKGHWRQCVDLDSPELTTTKFLINKGALPYVTIDVTNLKYDCAITLIGKKVDGLEMGSRVRIRGGRSDPLTALNEWGKGTYQLFHWQVQPMADDGSDNREVGNVIEKISTVAITQNNILDLISERLDIQSDEDEVKRRALNLASELLRGRV